MANVARLIVAGSLPAAGMIFTTVKAAEKVHPSELDIYDKPSLVQEVALEEPPSDLEKKVSGGRKMAQSYWGSMKDIAVKSQSLAQTATVNTSEFMELLASDQTFQIKVAVISSGVVIGAIAAGRGKRPFRRLFYSAGLGSVAFSACYPQKAWVIAQKGFQSGVEQSKVLFNKLKTMYEEQKQKQLTKAAEEKQTEIETNVTKSDEFVGEEPSETTWVEIPDTEPPKIVIVEDLRYLGSSSFTSAVDSESDRSYLSYIPFVGWFFKGSSSESFKVEAVVDEVKSSDVQDKSENCECELKKAPTKAKTEVAGDHGMSNPEDKDMYSTRE